MAEEKQYGGLDYFRMAAAFLVAAIHTSPLASFSTEADFVLTRVAARVAVPFFFMATGFFLLPQYLFGHSMDNRPLRRLLKKLFLLYGIAILLYLPVNLYAGQFEGAGIGGVLRMVWMDGTFYHLWYLPAVMWGAVLVRFLSRGLPWTAVTGVSIFLYLIGLFGDSYYGFAEQVPALRAAYGVLFSISSYTRNGIFYAPVFLVMGAGISRLGNQSGILHVVRARIAAGFVISLGLMTAEGLLLHRFGIQRHDSMYIMLPPAMFFLFRLLLTFRAESAKRLRMISMWIYLLHPLCIILVRGGAKAVRMESLFVENSLAHYLVVCVVSCFCACVVAFAGKTVAERIASKRKAAGITGFTVGKQKRRFAEGRAWIELNREHLRENVRMLESLLSPGQLLMPAMKANAYGHGAVTVAKELQNVGIRSFCVACVAEGVELRKGGVTGEILVLGYTHPMDFPLLRKYDLIQTVVDYAYGRLLDSCGKKVRVHVKIDTGMHRLGERAEKKKEIRRIFRLKNLRAEGLYTHLSADETRDPAERAFTEGQASLFYEAAGYLNKRGIIEIKTHLLASYGLLNYPELGGDYVRAGIALYGLLSDRQGAENCKADLRPVMSVKVRIAVVKDLYQGESAGYGFSYRAAEDRKIAVLAIGYADGLPRSLSSGCGRVLIHGKSAPIAGRICMDQTIVDITGIEGVKAGETATIMGRDGNEEITAYEIAEKAGTITNEIVSRMGVRLERAWGS